MDASEMDASEAELTVIIVSYNTNALNLAALRTLYETTHETRMHVVVFDNASSDGSADAIAAEFPQVELIRSPENLGFAKANNIVAETARTPWILLLNPDTECHPGAIDNLMRFARETPDAGIWGGRTVFRDGSLNMASCWNRMTLWSVFCRSSGVSAIMPGSEALNPEAMGNWQRDSVRAVDIVVGCFFLMQKPLWDELGGFDLKYFMYGEESDLCLRAAAKGYQPMVTPDAQIMHLVGAASSSSARKKVLVNRARTTLMRDHWPKWQVPLGLGIMWGGAGLRALAETLLRKGSRSHREIWAERGTWMAGYGSSR